MFVLWRNHLLVLSLLCLTGRHIAQGATSSASAATTSVSAASATLSTTSTAVTPSTASTTPTASTASTTPTASTASATPTASTASTTPTASTASTTPTASTASATPTASTASTTPTASTASATPTPSTTSATPTASSASTISTASTASATPTASTASTISTASTASATPTVSTASTTPTASTANTTSTASIANTTPTASSASTISTASTASITPTASTANTTPTASSASTISTASTASITPTASTANTTSTTSTASATPTPSTPSTTFSVPTSSSPTTANTATVTPAGNFTGNATYRISLSVLWSGDDMSAELQRQFYNLILPDIRAACPTSTRLNSTMFDVSADEIDQLPTLDDVNRIRSQLAADNFLFVGLKASPLTPLLQTVTATTTVPGYPKMVFHTIAPMPLDFVQSVLVKVIDQRIKEGLYPGNERNFRAALYIDDSVDISQMSILFQYFRNGILFYRYSDSTLQASLLDVKAQSIVNIIVLLPADLSDKLKVAAFGLDMFAYKYRWFFHGPRLINLPVDTRMVTYSTNITSLEFGRVQSTLIKDLRTTSAVLLYDLLSIWKYYLRQYLCNESSPVSTTFTGYSGAFQLYPNGTVTRLNWQLQIYRGLEAKTQQIGEWSSNGTYNMLPQPDPARTSAMFLAELKLNPFRIVTIINPPFVMYKTGVSTSLPLKDRLTGMYIELCKQIISNMNLTNVNYFLQEDNAYGVFNVTWNGIIKTLIDGRAHLGCSPMTVETSRQAVVSFTNAIHSSSQSILYMTPPGNAFTEMFQFLQPLDTIIWLTVLAVLVFVAIVLAVMHWIIPNKGIKLTLYDSLFFSFAEVVQGTSGAVPNQLSGRIVVAFFWFFTLFLLLTYIANYSASRVLDGVQQKVESLQTLLQNNAYEFGVVRNTVTTTLLQSSVFVYMQQMYGLISDTFDNGMVDNTTVALQLMQNASQPYALIGDDLENQYLTQVNCNLVTTGQFYELKSALALPLSNEFSNYLNVEIAKLSATIAALKFQYFNTASGPTQDCTDRSFLGYVKAYTPPNVWQVKEGALTLTNTLGIAMINIFGCIFALILSAVERSFSRVLQRRSEARRQNQVSEAYAMAQRPTMLE